MKLFNRSIKVPTKPEDITIDQFEQYASLNEDEILDPLKLIPIFCNVKRKHIRLMTPESVNTIVQKIAGALGSQSCGIMQKITIDGVRFGLIPDFDEMSAGEYIDIERYAAERGKIANAMAVLYRPIIKEMNVAGVDRYLIEDYEGSKKYAPYMRKAPYSAYVGIRSFFLTLGTILSQAIPDSSIQKTHSPTK